MNEQAVIDLIGRIGRMGGPLDTAAGPTRVLRDLVATAGSVLAAADAIGVSRGQDGRFTTLVVTGPLARHTDELQYRIGHGPCLDAATDGGTRRSGDLGTDRRWPRFGPEAAERYGVHSSLSVPLQVGDTARSWSINSYATRRDAFTAGDQAVAELLGRYGGAVLAAAAGQEKVRNLEIALDTSRDIGAAIGILMARYLLTQDQGFQLLQLASQGGHRKLRDVAAEVLDTGDLPEVLRVAAAGSLRAANPPGRSERHGR